ncbi:hypothetical protein HK104_003290 [Borealophlyctis nickersoniae]|nr:hypothetical protein HK104_003290 [Borealophlyctis nickersoniae]
MPADALDVDAICDDIAMDQAPPTYEEFKSLTQWWINERCAPELLMYQGDTVANLREMLECQTAILEDNPPDTPESAFHVVLRQQEMERVKFVIRSYVRTRLAKIQKYTPLILSEPEYTRRLSQEELEFAERFQKLIDEHFDKSCLDGLEHFIRRLDENEMVSKPDLENAVMCRVKEDIGNFQLDERSDIFMAADNVFLLRYKSIRGMIEDNKVELV